MPTHTKTGLLFGNVLEDASSMGGHPYSFCKSCRPTNTESITRVEKIQCIARVNKNSLSILRHESVPSRSVPGRQHNRTVLTQNGSGSMKINVCAKTEPPVEHALHCRWSYEQLTKFHQNQIADPFCWLCDPSRAALQLWYYSWEWIETVRILGIRNDTL